MVDPRPFLQPHGWWQDLVLPPAFAITEEQWATRGQAYMSQGFPVEVACVHDAMVALGARIPVDATEDCAWQHRMEIAEMVWHKRKLLYTSRCHPLKLRTQAFYAEVVASLLWGADNWTISRATAKALEQWERTKWISILGLSTSEKEPTL